MISVGQRFRDERIRQGREIKPIADELCITSRYLQAIEADDWQQLPGGFFGRSFIRQYAIALGLDPAEFESIIPSTAPEPELVPIQTLAHSRQEQEIAVPPLVAPRGKGFFDLKMWAAVAGLVVAVVAGSSLYSWFEESRNGKGPQITAEPKLEQSTPEQPEASNRTSTVEGLLSLSVAATESTWLEISSNGQRLFSGLLEVGQSRQFEKTESARMVVGNAGGVVVRRSGRDIGPIGSRGQVKVILFRSDAWEILQPAPLQKTSTSDAATADED